MAWRSALLNAFRGTGQVPKSLRVAVALAGLLLLAITIWIFARMVSGEPLTELALIGLAMYVLTALALIRSGHEISTSDPDRHRVGPGAGDCDPGAEPKQSAPESRNPDRDD